MAGSYGLDCHPNEAIGSSRCLLIAAFTKEVQRRSSVGTSFSSAKDKLTEAQPKRTRVLEQDSKIIPISKETQNDKVSARFQGHREGGFLFDL